MLAEREVSSGNEKFENVITGSGIFVQGESYSGVNGGFPEGGIPNSRNQEKVRGKRRNFVDDTIFRRLCLSPRM